MKLELNWKQGFQLINKPSVLLILFCICFNYFTNDLWKTWHTGQTNMEWDNVNYYSYNPAFIVNKGSFDFNNEVDKFLPELPNGKRIPTKTYGIALLQSPFFLYERLLQKMEGQWDSGFSTDYADRIHWAGIIYTFIGLFFLRRFLLYYYSEWITAATLAIVFLGTNLFYYSLGASEMDPAYLFFLISFFLVLNYKWQQQPTLPKSILMGLVLGLISLIRTNESILILFVFFWNVYNKESLRLQFLKLLQHKKELVVLGLCFIVVWIPQLIFWKSRTGNFFFTPYPDEQYFWFDPQVFNILFSFRKGWLLYSPLVLLAFIGFFLIKDEGKKLRSLFILVLLVNIYVLSSWWNWFYGGGFGGRVFAQDLAWLSLPIAGLFSFLNEKRHVSKIYEFILFLVFVISFSGISLNLGQTYQFTKNYIHYDATSKESYTFMFGKYDLYGKEGDKYWTLLKYHDNEKLKSGENRDQ